MTNSPYTPDGLQWAWNSTSIAVAKDCWRKYYYQQRLSWVASGHNVHITFGLHYAKACERFHKFRAEGLSYPDALAEVVRLALEETVDWHSDHTAKNRENLIRSIVWYLEWYKDDPCHTVMMKDDVPAVELSFLFQASEDIWFCGHLDRLVEYAGNVYVQDQKTTGSTLSSYYFKRYNPDPQMSLYSLAGEVVFNSPIAGVMIDAAQIAVGFTRFERGFTHRTKQQLEEWTADTLYHISTQAEARDRGWPMNDSACQKYGGCPFIEVCSKDSRVRDEFLATGFEKHEFNPLEIR